MQFVLNNLPETEIRIKIAEYIDDLLIGLTEEEFKYVDMKLVESRISGDNSEDSDLDVVLYYSGTIKEDGLFNLLNDDSSRLFIGDVLIDINSKKIPIY